MKDGRLTNKRLVRRLMDTKGVEEIFVAKDKVQVKVCKGFTPERARQLVHELGHESARSASKDGENYLIFARW